MDIRFLFVGGLRIACARWDSRRPAHGVVQIVHGMGEHSGRYVSLIEVCDDSTQKSNMACRIASSSEQELKKAARGVQTGERIGHARQIAPCDIRQWCVCQASLGKTGCLKL